MKDAPLPLNCASPEVWAELDRLGHEITYISSKSTGRDKDRLQRLLKMIRKVRAQGRGPSKHVDAEAHETWVAGQPSLTSRGPSDVGSRTSLASSSTAVTAGDSGATVTPPSEHGLGGAIS
jgi:hypothetical protein